MVTVQPNRLARAGSRDLSPQNDPGDQERLTRDDSIPHGRAVTRPFSYQTTLLVPMVTMSGAPSAFMSATSMYETATLPLSSSILSQDFVLGT